MNSQLNPQTMASVASNKCSWLRISQSQIVFVLLCSLLAVSLCACATRSELTSIPISEEVTLSAFMESERLALDHSNPKQLSIEPAAVIRDVNEMIRIDILVSGRQALNYGYHINLFINNSIGQFMTIRDEQGNLIPFNLVSHGKGSSPTSPTARTGIGLNQQHILCHVYFTPKTTIASKMISIQLIKDSVHWQFDSPFLTQDENPIIYDQPKLLRFDNDGVIVDG